MSDIATKENTTSTPEETTEGMTKIIYFLYLAGILFGITGVVGVIMAYIYKDDSPDWLQTHYQFQIRTFWIGAIFMLVGGILMFVLIGYFVMLFWVVWLLIRSIKGMKALDKKEAHPNPTGWFFS